MKSALAALGLAAAPLLTGCEAISKLNYVPVTQDPILGAEAYPQLLGDEQTITSGPRHRTVVSMTERLVTAARQLDPEVADLFEWEVTLVRRDDLVNAWCLPGARWPSTRASSPWRTTDPGTSRPGSPWSWATRSPTRPFAMGRGP